MSRLADVITAQPATSKGPTCTIGRLLRTLPDDDAADLAKFLADEFVTARAIRAGIQALGYQLSEHSVQRHRRGGCACPRPV